MKINRVFTAAALLLAMAAGMLFPTVLKKKEDGDLGKVFAEDSMEAISLDYNRQVSFVEKLNATSTCRILTTTELGKGIFLTEEQAQKSALLFLEKLTGNTFESVSRVEATPYVIFYENFGSLVVWTAHIQADLLEVDLALDDTTGGVLSFHVDNTEESWEILWEVMVNDALLNGDVRTAIREGITDALRESWMECLHPQTVYVSSEGTIYGGGREADDSGDFFGEIFWGELEIMVSDDDGHECVLPVRVLDNWTIAFND